MSELRAFLDNTRDVPKPISMCGFPISTEKLTGACLRFCSPLHAGNWLGTSLIQESYIVGGGWVEDRSCLFVPLVLVFQNLNCSGELIGFA